MLGSQPTDGLGANLTITGRQLTHYTITSATTTGASANVDVGYAAVNSNFDLILRGIEYVGSAELIGTPSAGVFRVAISGAAPSANLLQGYINTTFNGQGVVGTIVQAFTY